MIQRCSEADDGIPCRAYRAYLVSPEGHFVDVLQLYCETDEEAMSEARRLAGTLAVELWERNRKVAFIPAP